MAATSTFECFGVRKHHVQSQGHHFCGDCFRFFSSEKLRIKHMTTKHLYCRAHDTTFKSEDELVSHYRQSVEHPFCVTCECDFDDEDELWDHAEEDHHACGQCHLLFDSHNELQEHDRDVHSYCTDCQENFLSTSSLRHHLKIQHGAPDQWYCLAHDMVFKSKDDLQSHYNQSLDHHYCIECENDFDEDEFWDHAEKDHHACRDCHELFGTYDELKEHDSDKHHYCTDCKKGFQSASNLRHHLTIEHMAAKNWYCQAHDRFFKSEDGLQSHYRHSLDHHFCTECENDFDSEDMLWEHAEKDHHACQMCRELFDSYEELQEHDRDKHNYCTDCQMNFWSASKLRHHLTIEHTATESWYCQAHDRLFKTEDGLQSHYRDSLDHHFCRECEDDFDNEDMLWEHAERDHHACQMCREMFDSHEELQAHDRDVHIYCTECKRSFQNESNIRHHLNSKLHQPTNVRCPGRGCERAFVSHAALVFHFESGTCSSRMTREKLNRLAVRADTTNYITNPARLLTGPQGGFEPPVPAATWATEFSWNGEAYECFLCNSEFKTLSRLNQHLQSPRHDEKIYRCPKSDCHTEFVTLSGLCQHVEGGTCGVRTFKRVRDTMESLTRGFNSLDM